MHVVQELSDAVSMITKQVEELLQKHLDLESDIQRTSPISCQDDDRFDACL